MAHLGVQLSGRAGIELVIEDIETRATAEVIGSVTEVIEPVRSTRSAVSMSGDAPDGSTRPSDWPAGWGH